MFTRCYAGDMEEGVACNKKIDAQHPGASSQGEVEANASILGLGGFFYSRGIFLVWGMCVQCKSKTVRLR